MTVTEVVRGVVLIGKVTVVVPLLSEIGFVPAGKNAEEPLLVAVAEPDPW